MHTHKINTISGCHNVGSLITMLKTQPVHPGTSFKNQPVYLQVYFLYNKLCKVANKQETFPYIYKNTNMDTNSLTYGTQNL